MLLLSCCLWEFHAEFLSKTLDMQPLMADLGSLTTTSISVYTQN